LGLGVLVLAILFDRDRAIFGDDELRAILERFEFAGDSPETGFDFLLCFEDLAPDLECDGACGISRGRVAEETALLGAALAHGGDENDKPQILAVGNFGDGNIAAHLRRIGVIGPIGPILKAFLIPDPFAR
jgi:hypothetical protein